MGNYFIYASLALFTTFWVIFADKLCFRLMNCLRIPQKFSEKGSWNWGLSLLTLFLLLAFALIAISLAPVLERIFESSQEVSQKGIALSILASLCLSWVISLNKLREDIADYYFNKK